MTFPTYSLETKLLGDYKYIAGIDEVGRGPLAGPVVAAAVVLNPVKIVPGRSKNKWWYGVRDSKQLSPAKRIALADFIKDNAFGFGLGFADNREIDELNIHNAVMLSMRRAVARLEINPEVLLIDGKFDIDKNPAIAGFLSPVQKTITKGDEKILSIACASILAKVYRDDLMKNFSKKYFQFGFEKHKGYGTEFHRKRLFQHGPCAIHRMTFQPVRDIMNRRFRRFISL